MIHGLCVSLSMFSTSIVVFKTEPHASVSALTECQMRLSQETQHTAIWIKGYEVSQECLMGSTMSRWKDADRPPAMRLWAGLQAGLLLGGYFFLFVMLFPCSKVHPKEDCNRRIKWLVMTQDSSFPWHGDGYVSSPSSMYSQEVNQNMMERYK